MAYFQDLAARVRRRLFSRPFVELEKSPTRALLSKATLRDHVARLKRHLADDAAPEVVGSLDRQVVKDARQFDWFQRLRIPDTPAYTTSDPRRRRLDDPGWLNRLGNALSAEEGAALRPMPKWAYLEGILPVLGGKSVLELGSNNGFFCFEFLAKGAARVTGIEVNAGFIVGARWMAQVRRAQNIAFIQTDAMLDLSLEPHDVVFMSEVYTHFIDPLFGLLRAINLARETLVIDGPMLPGFRTRMNLNVALRADDGKPEYLAWTMSDGLFLKYLALCGVPPEKVVRYLSPLRNHIVYVIDTSEVADYRRRHEFAPYDTPFLQTKFRV
jgi:SAM-dependent methyltransferase